MNVSSINVGLTGEDLISIYNDFVAIKEIKISNIDVKEDIRISGSFTKGLTINFEVKVKLNSMENGLINGELTGFKILNIGIPSFIRKTILKFALKSLSDVGINYDKGKVIIEGIPRDVFSHVETMKKIGLDVPQVTEICYELRKAGIEIDTKILNVNEMVSALCQLR